MQLSESSGVSDKSLISFAIQDTASVDKISIYDNYFDRSFTVVRNEKGIWEDKDGNCVQQQIIGMMLETMNKMRSCNPPFNLQILCRAFGLEFSQPSPGCLPVARLLKQHAIVVHL